MSREKDSVELSGKRKHRVTQAVSYLGHQGLLPQGGNLRVVFFIVLNLVLNLWFLI